MTTRKRKNRSDQAEMGIFEHLEEFRQRLLRAVIALIIGVVIGTFLAEPLLAALIEPVRKMGVLVIVISPTESPTIFFKVAIVVGAVLAMPFIMYQLFMFVAPGLEPHEKRYIFIGAPTVSLCFALGVIFAAKVLLPGALPVLKGFLENIVTPQYSIDYYISFVTNILIWVGLVFETPLVMFFLAKLGVIDHRGFAKARRVVIVGAAFGAAIVTPTYDPANMMLVMIPFLVLYELGILLARLA